MAPHPINVLSLCAGVGMLDIAIGTAFDARTVCYIEREAYAASQLVNLMEAQCLDAAPVWSDLTTFDAASWRGKVDCVTAGFPCQPHSVAGKREGLNDERWIWDDIARIIRDSGAWLVCLENVPGLIATGGLAACLKSLAEMGFHAEWGCLSAGAVGASHKRERIFILAFDPKRGRGILRQPPGGCGFADGGDEELAYAERWAAERHGHELAESSCGVQGEARQQRLRADVGDGIDNMANPSDGLIQEQRRGSEMESYRFALRQRLLNLRNGR